MSIIVDVGLQSYRAIRSRVASLGLGLGLGSWVLGQSAHLHFLAFDLRCITSRFAILARDPRPETWASGVNAMRSRACPELAPQRRSADAEPSARLVAVAIALGEHAADQADLHLVLAM